MHADLEPPSGELTEDAVVDFVTGLHDIERRAETPRCLEVGDSQRVFEAVLGLHVVREGEGSPGSTRPEPAKSNLLPRRRNDRDQRGEQIAYRLVVRPGWEVRNSLTFDESPPKRQLEAAG